MKCPTCVEEGKRSIINAPGYGMTTAAFYQPYYDEDGKYHHHDGNITTMEYSCSEGHSWTDKRSGTCWCGWNGN